MIKPTISKEDILALERILELVLSFYNKNLIRKSKYDFNKLKNKIKKLKEANSEDYTEANKNLFMQVLNKLELIIKRDCVSNIFFLIGGHGGIIISDISYCEFDYPLYTFDQLLMNLELASENHIPYHLEIAICCLEYLSEKFPEKFSKFLSLLKKNRFEIINPTYSQPYNLIIGPESNIKQFEYGLKILKKFGLKNNIYYCTEVSYHPQIPQILKSYNINYTSLRTRIFGTCPSSHSGLINWIGLDDTKIKTITDQSGLYNGEYWHRAFYQEIPNLLFQAVSRPFMRYIIYSSIEDCVNPLPLQEDIWRISKFSELFGKFVSFSELINMIHLDGEFKYKRDDFYLGNEIFNQTDLFRYNKKCETALINAEIINTVLGLFERNLNDNFFEQSWSELLQTQAHDNYAVPFIQTGGYSAQHLTREDYNKLNQSNNRIPISELSISIQKRIIKNCKKFIEKSLTKISNFLKLNPKDQNKQMIDLFIFNPTIYQRKDIVEIALVLEDPSNYTLLNNRNEKVNFTYYNSLLKFIPEVPSIGYSVYSLIRNNKKNAEFNLNFLYSIKISEDHQNIEIFYEKSKVYVLKFNAIQDYILRELKQEKNSVENKIFIEGKFKSSIFNLEITQYNNVNRIEIQIHADKIKEVILIPSFQISKSFINYPFGIEETKRSQIQTLDFLWLKGTEKSIIYLQRNSQQFFIDREKFIVKNIIKKKGDYEISISVINDNTFYSAYREVYLYNFKLLGFHIDGSYHYVNETNSFFSIERPIVFTNLWRRSGNNYVRIINPDLKRNIVKLTGKLIKSPKKLLDFNYNVIEKFDNEKSQIDPWKIQTYTF
ncbi:MAG: hypothetical protein ACFFC9_05720 [Promethearchaeota archaeon]